jgi:hypothetical protein
MHEVNYEELALGRQFIRDDLLEAGEPGTAESLSYSSSSHVRSCDRLLSSCLIGSPTRDHSRVEEIAFPVTATQPLGVSPKPTRPSRIRDLLKSLQKDVKDLKNRHSVTQACPAGKQVIRLKESLTPRTCGHTSPARQILRDIQILLANAQDTISDLQDRVKISSDSP